MHTKLLMPMRKSFFLLISVLLQKTDCHKVWNATASCLIHFRFRVISLA